MQQTTSQTNASAATTAQTIKMTKEQFRAKYPSIANRLENYKQAFAIFERYQATDPDGANRYMRAAESDWNMAVSMAERQDVDLIGAAVLFGIKSDDSLSELGRACRKQLGGTMIEPA